MSGPTVGQLDHAVTILSDPQRQPVYVHCDHGVDRTGMVLAAYRIQVDGWTFERAYEEMRSHGFHEEWLVSWKSRLAEYAQAAP